MAIEKYKFLGPNKEYLKSNDKTCIAFILRYKKVYLGRGIRGFDHIIEKNPKLKNQLKTSGKDSILKYSGLLWPNANTIIFNNFPTVNVFNKYIILLDKSISRKKKLDGMEIHSLFIRKNLDKWMLKIGKMKYIPISKYRQTKMENVILNAKVEHDDDLKYEKIDKKNITIVPNSKEIRQEIKEYIQDQIEKNGEKLSYRNIFGRKYIVGIDNNDQVTVYDWDGTNYEIENFYDIVKERRKYENKLNNINKIDMYLKFIDKEPDNFVDDLAESRSNEIETKLLTDRDDIPKKLTRSYPVLEYNGRDLIVDGRFKGYYLDEMINLSGRQVAGTGYYLDENNMPRPIERKTDTLDERTIVTKHEPYVTYNDDTNRMVVVIPDNDKRTHTILNDLTKKYRGISKISKNTFTFSPMLYELIQRDVRGFVMSEKAIKIVKENITRDKKQLQEELSKTYDHISTSKIDGMKTQFPDGKPIEFMNHQKKAVDHLIKKGNGFIGLDTGAGKTMVAVGIMMQWINDGTLTENGRNGKVLFVGDASLRGNFPSEVKKFVEDYSEVKQYFDVISYNELKNNPEKYKQYGCIIFDEAQAMRNHKSKVHKMAKSIKHPHKILMTASVLEKSPVDLYNLISIKNNKTFAKKSDEDKERRDFINTFCERVGNKVIGLKDDPATKRMFRRWVRKETLYIDKKDIKEVDLPPITPPEDRTVSLEMPDKMKEKYRELTNPIKDTLKRMVYKYKNNELTKEEINQELSKVMGTLQKVNTFLQLPEKFLGKDFPNPKINYLKKYVNDRLDQNNSYKVVTFTDKPELAEKAGISLSKEIKFKKHIVGLSGGILVYKKGKIIENVNRSNMKNFTDGDGNPLSLGNYQVEILKKYLKDPDVCSFNLTIAYTKGHNLQQCNDVIHLDRDSWNNENMEQRTARVYRTGNINPVGVQILDNVNDAGDSLDEIQKYSMEIERQLFEELIDKSFDEEYIKKDQEYIKIADIQNLLKNKEAYYYQLNPNVKFSSKIKNE